MGPPGYTDKGRENMPKHIIAFIVVAALGAAATVYGGVCGSDAALGVGLPVGFLSLLFIPILYVRANKRRRLFARQDALLVWDYAPYEAERIAAGEARKTRKTSVQLSVLMAVCLAILFAPFIFFVEIPQSARQLLMIIGPVTVLLPFASIYFAPAYTVSQIRRCPCRTIIGPDYILLSNRYIGINDRADLRLVRAEVKHGAGGEETLQLTYTFKMKYGNPHQLSCRCPDPIGTVGAGGAADRTAESKTTFVIKQK